jgi:uncharacterized protein (UPF0332 family)
MRKIKFIENLIIDEKIELVEESKEIYESYNKKSENSLKAAKILLQQELIEESISMSYYAMFHKTTSLFRLIGIKCENHAATIILLKELFKIDNNKISFAKEERIDKQYYTDFVITKEDTKDMIEKAEEFIEDIDYYIDKLTESKKKYFREIFKENYF